MNPEEVDTVRFDDRRWHPAVATVEDLPADDLHEGDLCLVTSENVVYEVQNGNWIVEIQAGILLD